MQYQENIAAKGTFRFITAPEWAHRLMQYAREDVGHEAFRKVADMLIHFGIAEQTVYHNLVVTGGKALLVAALAQDLATVSDLRITHQELGTGTNAPSYADTGLQTPAGGTTRKAVSSLGFSANVLSITSFWAVGEATGTWREYGLFIKGTGTSNSGTLWNRVAINQTVAADKALTIDGTVTLT